MAKKGTFSEQIGRNREQIGNKRDGKGNKKEQMGILAAAKPFWQLRNAASRRARRLWEKMVWLACARRKVRLAQQER
jgi:hypothetical protein